MKGQTSVNSRLSYTFRNLHEKGSKIQKSRIKSNKKKKKKRRTDDIDFFDTNPWRTQEDRMYLSATLSSSRHVVPDIQVLAPSFPNLTPSSAGSESSKAVSSSSFSSSKRSKRAAFSIDTHQPLDNPAGKSPSSGVLTSRINGER